MAQRQRGHQRLVLLTWVQRQPLQSDLGEGLWLLRLHWQVLLWGLRGTRALRGQPLPPGLMRRPGLFQCTHCCTYALLHIRSSAAVAF